MRRGYGEYSRGSGDYDGESHDDYVQEDEVEVFEDSYVLVYRLSAN
jgi:hypothetical protein